MSEVLVLVEHTDGEVKKVTSELLTLARRLGEPSAVFVGPGFDAAKAALAEHGAAKVYVADAAELSSYLVAPTAEVLDRIVRDSSPAAVLIASGAEGKEIAARLAIKTGSGVLTDATDVTAEGGTVTAEQPVFGGSTVVRAEYSVQEFLAFLGVMRAGTGCMHSKRLPGSKDVHCAQACNSVPQRRQRLSSPTSAETMVPHCAHRTTSR